VFSYKCGGGKGVRISGGKEMEFGNLVCELEMEHECEIH
jgi:hypothetical protein